MWWRPLFASPKHLKTAAMTPQSILLASIQKHAMLGTSSRALIDQKTTTPSHGCEERVSEIVNQTSYVSFPPSCSLGLHP
jgi:hypothetical protein